jgi:hypothetical protein
LIIVLARTGGREATEFRGNEKKIKELRFAGSAKFRSQPDFASQAKPGAAAGITETLYIIVFLSKFTEVF